MIDAAARLPIGTDLTFDADFTAARALVRSCARTLFKTSELPPAQVAIVRVLTVLLHYHYGHCTLPSL